MLSSSDAKLRCLWHMVVWSVMLILVSQFLILTEHIAFYIFASFCNLILPVITSIYSTTSGRHGAGLLRVFYVICDPVLAMVTILPTLLFTVLPELIDEHTCFSLPGLNETITCLINETSIPAKELARLVHQSDALEAGGGRSQGIENVRQEMLWEKHERMVTIQLSLIFPALLTLAMGRRTRKMNYTTSLLVAAYWLVIAIELCDLIQIATLGHRFIHSIYTTEAIASIAMILSTSYGAVTLCSYVSPMGSTDNRVLMRRFDYIYRCLVGIVGIVFAEIPLLVARCRIITTVQLFYEDTDGTDPISSSSGAELPSRQLYGGTPPLPASFYAWMIKDAVFVALIALVAAMPSSAPWCRIAIFRNSCAKAVFDDPHQFEPEKRDIYIGRHRRERHASDLEATRDGCLKPESSRRYYKKQRSSLPLAFSGKHRSHSKYAKRSTNGGRGRGDTGGQYNLVNGGNTGQSLHTVFECVNEEEEHNVTETTLKNEAYPQNEACLQNEASQQNEACSQIESCSQNEACSKNESYTQHKPHQPSTSKVSSHSERGLCRNIDLPCTSSELYELDHTKPNTSNENLPISYSEQETNLTACPVMKVTCRDMKVLDSNDRILGNTNQDYSVLIEPELAAESVTNGTPEILSTSVEARGPKKVSFNLSNRH